MATAFIFGIIFLTAAWQFTVKSEASEIPAASTSCSISMTPEDCRRSLPQPLPGASFGGQSLDLISATTPNTLVVQIKNYLNVPLTNYKLYLRDGRTVLDAPNNIRAQTKEVFTFDSEDAIPHGTFLYRIDNSNLALHVYFESGWNWRRAGIAFLNDFQNPKRIMDARQRENLTLSPTGFAATNDGIKDADQRIVLKIHHGHVYAKATFTYAALGKGILSVEIFRIASVIPVCSWSADPEACVNALVASEINPKLPVALALTATADLITGESYNGKSLEEISDSIPSEPTIAVEIKNYLDKPLSNYSQYIVRGHVVLPAPNVINANTKEVFTFATNNTNPDAAFSYHIDGSDLALYVYFQCGHQKRRFAMAFLPGHKNVTTIVKASRGDRLTSKPAAFAATNDALYGTPNMKFHIRSGRFDARATFNYGSSDKKGILSVKIFRN